MSSKCQEYLNKVGWKIFRENDFQSRILYHLIICEERKEMFNIQGLNDWSPIIFLRKLLKNVLHQNKLVNQEWEKHKPQKI